MGEAKVGDLERPDLDPSHTGPGYVNLVVYFIVLYRMSTIVMHQRAVNIIV